MIACDYAGVMAGFQVPVATAAQRIGGARTLAAGTAIAAAFAPQYALQRRCGIALVIGGLGSRP